MFAVSPRPGAGAGGELAPRGAPDGVVPAERVAVPSRQSAPAPPSPGTSN